MPRVYVNFQRLLWCLKYANLQIFYGEYVNLQRFCRDFMVPRVCQFTETLHDKAKRVKSS